MVEKFASRKDTMKKEMWGNGSLRVDKECNARKILDSERFLPLETASLMCDIALRNGGWPLYLLISVVEGGL